MRGHEATWQVQGRDEITVNSGAERVFALLADARRLPEWMPVVTHSDGEQESLGQARRCSVNFQGRSGEVFERCVVFEPPSRIGWLLESDTLGFSRLLKNFTFDFVLHPLEAGRTRVVNTSYFEPAGLVARLIIAVALRRNFAVIRRSALAGIKRLVEAEVPADRAAAAEPAMRSVQ
jgi:uncharacterized protein YndB with AHSA1/START domain